MSIAGRRTPVARLSGVWRSLGILASDGSVTAECLALIGYNSCFQERAFRDEKQASTIIPVRRENQIRCEMIFRPIITLCRFQFNHSLDKMKLRRFA
jgi:hypothetical protein